GREMTQGLTTMTGMTGGAFFSGVARATGVFDRIKTELTNYYELALETLPEDKDGKLRTVDVKVSRPGVIVRARRHVAAPPPAKQTDVLLPLLQQPTDLAELPLAVTSYTTRGDDAKTLRVLLSAEVG